MISGKERTLDLILLAWTGIGAVIFAALFIMWWPPGPTLGVAWSPERMFLQGIGAITIWIPLWLLGCNQYFKHKEWMAADEGEDYDPKKKYKIWTTRRVVSSAIMIAMTGACGVLPASVFDIAQFTLVFGATFFDPMVGALGMMFGNMLMRAPLGGSFNPFMIAGWMFTDAFSCAWVGYLYSRWVRFETDKRKRYLRLIMVILIHYNLTVACWNENWDIVPNPMPGLVYTLTIARVAFMTHCMTAGIAAFLCCEAGQKYKK